MCDTDIIFIENINAGDIIVNNNLLVEGDVINLDVDFLTFGGNYIVLNREHTDPVGENGGLVMNYLPTATQDDVEEILGDLISFQTSGSGTFSAGDIIVVNDANTGLNNGMYCVASHVGNVVTIDTAPASTVDFCRTSFTEAGVPATATTATHVNVSVLRANTSGDWEMGIGSSGPISYSTIQPAGTIQLWSGSLGTIPNGWQLCDGTNGSPDLRDRFVVGAGATYVVTDTGGSNTHILTDSEVPVRDHVHEYSRTDSVTINEVSRQFAEEQSYGLFPTGFFGTFPSVPFPDIPGINFPSPLPNFPSVNLPDVPAFNIPPTSVDFAPGSGFIWQDLIEALVPAQTGIGTGTTATNNETTDTTSNPTTSPAAAPHENRPPYYALAFIFKLPL